MAANRVTVVHALSVAAPAIDQLPLFIEGLFPNLTSDGSFARAARSCLSVRIVSAAAMRSKVRACSRYSATIFMDFSLPAQSWPDTARFVCIGR
jgi:hypothetical protein